MAIPVLQPSEIDALTEACNIGMGHAATALSQLMGKGVNIQSPRLQMLTPSSVARLLDSEQVRGLHLQILGNVRGSIMILLREENARRVLELLLGEEPSPGQPLSEMEVSTLKEVGNILASACLNALGLMLGMTLLPSVPTLVSGEAGVVLGQLAESPREQEGVLMIDTVFSIDDTSCGGSIFLMPAHQSLDAISTALGTRG